jgi:hypothetical protein
MRVALWPMPLLRHILLLVLSPSEKTRFRKYDARLMFEVGRASMRPSLSTPGVFRTLAPRKRHHLWCCKALFREATSKSVWAADGDASPANSLGRICSRVGRKGLLCRKNQHLGTKVRFLPGRQILPCSGET